MQFHFEASLSVNRLQGVPLSCLGWDTEFKRISQICRMNPMGIGEGRQFNVYTSELTLISHIAALTPSSAGGP